MNLDLPAPPEDREEILATVGPQRAQIYHAVRRILDGLERVAPWKDLYYPPTEVKAFVKLHASTLELYEEIPYRVSGLSFEIIEAAVQGLLRSLSDAELDASTRQVLIDLLADRGSEPVSSSMKRIGDEAVRNLPDASVPPPLKELLLWLIYRDEENSPVELTEENYEEALACFPDDLLDSSMKQILPNIQFYFDGIHMMSRGDMEKLQGRIEFFQNVEPDAYTGEDRVFTCEIAADLKGKYSSAIMGAAANLVAEGRWNGAEVEPILFPEKADEAKRNEQLLETLQEVLESIQRVPEEVPLVDIVESWRQEERVDRYALTHLYSFLSSVGKLMKESSRRALYSGDYHQIQLREGRLSARINELNMLHNQTWEVVDAGDHSLIEHYPRMVDRAIELAAVLDGELLKKLIGGEKVGLLFEIVSIEGIQRKAQDVRLGRAEEADFRTPQSIALREKLPLRLLPIIELLYDEDLQTFLELLLGSVMKRASFSVKRRRTDDGDTPSETEAAVAETAPAATTATTKEPSPVEEIKVPDLSIPELEPVAPAASPQADLAAEKEKEEKLEELGKLRDLLKNLLSATHPHRKSFDLVHRLLKQKGMIPPAMLQSLVPFVEELTEKLVPQLASAASKGGISIVYQGDLTQYCRTLARRDFTPREMKVDVLNAIDGLLRLLADLEAEAEVMIDTFSSDGTGSGEPLQVSEEFLSLE